MQVTKHQILIPTIYLLAAARDICLVFTPTLPHLRAYLATYTPHNGSRNGTTIYQKPGVQVPMLALLNPLSIHRTTSEHSAQGLSRTFALAVEAAARGCMQLTVSESSTPQEEVLMDAGDGYGDTLQIDPWKEQVSLLNGSIKFRGEDRVWAGRTLEVGRVVERWCRRIQIFDEQNGG
ncbi:hypothetical protein MMC06_001702 [Schaereria dolodes]|nr:hypothetical protein [Schaereria dolodes]